MTLTPGTRLGPYEIQALLYLPYDVSEDGRFLALVRTDATVSAGVRVVLGWTHDVARLGSRCPLFHSADSTDTGSTRPARRAGR
jgi:hypothetical protein